MKSWPLGWPHTSSQHHPNELESQEVRDSDESRLVAKIVVVVGLVVLIVFLLAFVWLFVLGNGFEFPY